MTWDEMDYDEKVAAIWRATHDGKIVKEIATEHETTSRAVSDLARRAGLVVRTHVAPTFAIRARRQKRTPMGKFSTGYTQERADVVLNFADLCMSIEDRSSENEAVH